MTILDEILAERTAQVLKWGEQNHPSVRKDELNPQTRCDLLGIPPEHIAKWKCEKAAKYGILSWSHIALEEFSEAVSAADDTARRAELVQLAAVAVAWIDCIDRKGASNE